MRLLLSLLKKYVDIDYSVEELAEKLLLCGIEVENIEYLSAPFAGVKVAEVRKKSKHPSADTLCVAEVFDGTKSYTVVCGASNCREGMLTAFAPVGATLSRKEKPLCIELCQIRGIRSEGMLCAEEELGFSITIDGIMELDDAQVSVGQDLAALYDDVAFDLGLTPNLGHAFSVVGIARELAAMCDLPLKKATWQSKKPIKGRQQFTIERRAQEACPRYSYLHVDAVVSRPSPLWLRRILEASHIRPINVLVDITNLAMLEMGQPLHAFDAKAIVGNRLIIREATEEMLELIDGSQKQLGRDVLVIADEKKPLACAGIMGGRTSAISETTTEVIFESAYFTNIAIRKGRKFLGMHTDSSKHFEKGVDPTATMHALSYVEELLEQLVPGAVLIGSSDDASSSFDDSVITCRRSRASRILGQEVSAADMEMAFGRYGFASKWDGQDCFQVYVPARRHDIKEEIDLIEEVAKLFGFAPDSQPAPYEASKMENNPLFVFENRIRSQLIAEGLQECITCDLISPFLANAVVDHPIAKANLIEVLNPMSQEQSILRPSLVPGLLDVLRRNACMRIFDIAAFEIGNIHLRKKELYTERPAFTIMLAGLADPYYFDRTNIQADFYQLKGILENLFSGLGFADVHCTPSTVSLFHPGRQAKIMVQGAHVGMIGQLHPQLLRAFDIPQNVVMAECDIQDVFELPRPLRKMQPLDQFPGSDRDWTITLNESVPLDELLSAIKEARCSLLVRLELRAIWRNEKLGADKKNVTLRFLYRDKTKTLSQKEVDNAHAQVVEHVVKNFWST